MSWLFSQALVEACSPQKNLDGVPCALWSSTHTPPPCWFPDKTMGPLSLSRSGTTCVLLTDDHGAELLTLYLEDSRARTSPQQTSMPREFQEPSQDSGSSSPESSERFDLDLLLSKTALDSVSSGLTSSLAICQDSGTMQNGVCSPVTMSPRPTRDKDAGSWPTPRCMMKSSMVVCKRKTALNLEERVAVVDGVSGGYLNPPWIEWLMGWPIGWTACTFSETVKSLSVQQRPSESCTNEQPLIESQNEQQV